MSEASLKELSLIEHLRELRKRLINIGILLFLGSLVGWFFKEQLFDIVRAPIEPYLTETKGGLSYTGPMESFIGYLKVAVLGGVIATCPLWMYQVWLFIAPALYAKEKKYALGFIFFGSVLFALGVSFAYFLVYPFVFEFLLGFGQGKDQAIITIKEYLGFFIKSVLLFGLSFEMPLVLTILGAMGVVDYAMLKKTRRHAVVIIAIISALLTPPDPLSMLMMLVPLYSLYELSIFCVRWVQPKDH